jgi:hypothetical protein
MHLLSTMTLAAALTMTHAACGHADDAGADADGAVAAPSDRGDDATPPAATPPAATPPAADEGDDGAVGEPGTAPSGTGVDQFGVTELYPSKEGGEAWALADDATSDPRFDPQVEITRNDDGSWKMTSTKVRMNVMTSTGYDSGKMETQNRDELAARGYMEAPNDWKNVEITGFVKVNAADDMTDNFAWYARGGRHNDEVPCEGSAYKGDLHYDGTTRWAKESWHVSYDYLEHKPATESLQGRWVGWKVVIRNVDNDQAVRMESYVNEDGQGQNWKQVYDFTDDGTWAGDLAFCGASNTKAPMVWGGPIVTYRWDSATDVDFKWLSVREIQP